MTSFIKVIMPKPDELTNESYKTPSTQSQHLITAKTEVSATCKLHVYHHYIIVTYIKISGYVSQKCMYNNKK